VQGIQEAGGQAEEIRLNDLHIAKCSACGDGWGTCRTQHECQEVDDFQTLHMRLPQFDGYVMVTPVYWWEMSESAKAFTDRLRRCEGTAGEASKLSEKPIIAVAAAGGSGNGTVTCLLSMENWIKHVRARRFDLVSVTRWTRPYKLETIRQAAQAMVRESKH
jgi:multimeric flavodoxin WrbA